MTTTAPSAISPVLRRSVDRPIRPRNWPPAAIAVLIGSALSGTAIVWTIFRVTPLDGVLGFMLCTLGAFVSIYWLVERDLHGNLAAKDRVASVLVGTAGIAVIFPLLTIIVFVVGKGITALRPGFFTQTMASVGPQDPGGGALHAIVGTLMQVAIAMMISVPLGVMAAVFLNEIGGRFARPVRSLVDAMSGVPSIVAGLFIFAIWNVQFGRGFSGLAGGLALSVLMLPTVIRTAEEVLRLVPDGLREASLALGAPQWRTVAQVVLPTARAGLFTAVILGVARAVGETAPLIMTTFGTSDLNLNPANGPQASLPLYVYTLIRQPLDQQVNRAWTGALVLIGLVLVLFVIARVLGRRKPGVKRNRVRRLLARKQGEPA